MEEGIKICPTSEDYKYSPDFAPITRGDPMEDTLCTIEILRTDEGYMAKVHTSFGRYMEYRNADFENLMQELYEDLYEEFEGV